MFPFRNASALKQIINFHRPKFWIDTQAEAVKKAVIHDGVSIVGMGLVPGRHRDLIADMAGFMSTWEDVKTAIAFAIIDGTRIEGSVRSTNASVSVPELCKELGGRHGEGGGKLGKGAYRYDLGGGGIDDDDDDDTKQKTWELFNEKETKRIRRIIKQ